MNWFILLVEEREDVLWERIVSKKCELASFFSAIFSTPGACKVTVLELLFFFLLSRVKVVCV